MYIPHPIIVQFEESSRGFKGRTLLNPFGPHKIAFIDERARLPVQPGNNEVWLCDLKHDTDTRAGDRHGALIVLPVRPVDQQTTTMFRASQRQYALWSQDQCEVRFMTGSMLQLAQRPEHFGVLAEAVSKLRLHHLRNPFMTTKIELRRMIGSPDLLSTREITLDTPDTFAKMSGFEHPVRVVVLPRAEQESCMTVKIKYADRRLFVSHFNVGTLSVSEPISPRTMNTREHSIRFWTKHAHVFQPEIMDQPFMSTWRELMDIAARKPEPKRVREPKRRKDPEPDPDREMDGPLLV